MGSDTYSYDANGNQMTRNVSGSSYTLGYDAENHLVSVTGAATATFYYDGDGNRVKGTIGGTTTTYIGNYFEWTGSTGTMKRYYYAGSTRVAMRKGSTLYYLLGDHLGSLAITATSTGTKSAETRYYPWGTERYNYGTNQTSFHFTGQRLESGIGLYFYGARWFDPAAGRFVQPDTIIPGAGNSQSWDRYAYTLNNPIRYKDPSGHLSCSAQHVAEGDCSDYSTTQILEDFYGISLEAGNLGKFTGEEISAIYRAVQTVGAKFSQAIGGGKTSGEAFKQEFGYTIFLKGNGGADGGSSGLSGECMGIGSGGCTSNADLINFVAMSGSSTNDISRMAHNVVHELGHSYDISRGFRPRTDIPDSFVTNRENILHPNQYEGRLDWQQNLDMTPGETFADMFIAWTYDVWNTEPGNAKDVAAAQAWMDGWMP